SDAETFRRRLVRAAGRRDERPRLHRIRDPHHPAHGVKCLGRVAEKGKKGGEKKRKRKTLKKGKPKPTPLSRA
ncbi:hypothetical protein N311_06647, partial [Apaloderma vittatum]